MCVCVVRVHVRRTQSSKKNASSSVPTSRFPFLLPLLTRPHLLSGRFGLFSPGDRNLWWNLAIWCLLPLLLLLLLPLVSLDVAWCPSWMTLALGSVYLCGHAPFLYFAHSDDTLYHTASQCMVKKIITCLVWSLFLSPPSQITVHTLRKPRP